MIKVNEDKHNFIKFKSILKFFEIFNIYTFILVVELKIISIKKNFLHRIGKLFLINAFILLMKLPIL